MKIVILPTIEPRVRQLDTGLPLELGLAQFPTWDEEKLESYGCIWARVWPSDIVMLVEA